MQHGCHPHPVAHPKSLPSRRCSCYPLPWNFCAQGSCRRRPALPLWCCKPELGHVACASSSCKCGRQPKIHPDLQGPKPWHCWLLQIYYHLFADMVRTLWIIMNSYIWREIYVWHTNWVEVSYVWITAIYAWHTNWVEVSYVRITESEGITILYHHIYLMSDKMLSGKFQQDGFFFS